MRTEACELQMASQAWRSYGGGHHLRPGNNADVAGGDSDIGRCYCEQVSIGDGYFEQVILGSWYF